MGLEAAVDNPISREISRVLKNRLQNSGIMMQAEDVVGVEDNSYSHTADVGYNWGHHPCFDGVDYQLHQV